MSINFECPNCHKKFIVEDEYAGATAECTQCHQQLTVPAVAAVTEPPASEAVAPAAEPAAEVAPEQSCPKCGAAIHNRAAVICTNCGQHLKLGVNVKTAQAAKKVGRFGMAVLAGALAAALGGGLWGLIGIAFDMEIGWVAWLLGIATGLTVRAVTGERTFRVGVMAIVMAAGGILLGKLIIAEHIIANENTFVSKTLAMASLCTGAPLGDDELAMLLQLKLTEEGALPDPYTELGKLSESDVDSESREFKKAVARAEKIDAENLKKAQDKVKSMNAAGRAALVRELENRVLIEYLQGNDIASGQIKLKITEEELTALAEKPNGDKKALEAAQTLYQSEMARAEAVTKAKVAAMSDAEVKTQLKTLNRDAAEATVDLRSSLRNEVFVGLFSFMDILFFAFALLSAYQLATKSSE